MLIWGRVHIYIYTHLYTSISISISELYPYLCLCLYLYLYLCLFVRFKSGEDLAIQEKEKLYLEMRCDLKKTAWASSIVKAAMCRRAFHSVLVAARFILLGRMI